ncbi:MAG TPA: DUF5668 domain-containing protein [Bryobacteraceae bacterium]|jgi:hypothetical protein
MNSRAAAFVQAARGPVLLITLGILFAMQQSGILDFSRSWPLLIIAIGVMKLIERMISPPAPYGPPPPPPPPPAAAGPYQGANYQSSPYQGGQAR